MTDESAKRYDTQVEVLFNGTANAIRRQGPPAVARSVRQTRSAQTEITLISLQQC
jgi:hypothetical protein